MLSLGTPHLYDWAVDTQVDGGLVDASRPGYRQVAAELREQILSGALAPGAALPAHSALSGELRVSQATISAAVGQLAAEGLVRVEHGKPTIVLARRRYRAEVAVGRADGDLVPLDALNAARDALGPLMDADPTIGEQDSLAAQGAVLTVMMEVDAADAAQAATRAFQVVAQALGGGWDLAGASVTARPA